MRYHFAAPSRIQRVSPEPAQSILSSHPPSRIAIDDDALRVSACRPWRETNHRVTGGLTPRRASARHFAKRARAVFQGCALFLPGADQVTAMPDLVSRVQIREIVDRLRITSLCLPQIVRR